MLSVDDFKLFPLSLTPPVIAQTSTKINLHGLLAKVHTQASLKMLKVLSVMLNVSLGYSLDLITL